MTEQAPDRVAAAEGDAVAEQATDRDQPPQVGEVRTWTDRIGQRHQGRVTGVDGDVVEFVTAHGATARVGLSFVEPPEAEATTAEQAAVRLAAVAHARKWFDVTLPKRLEDCVAGAWDALTVLEPDTDSDDLKVAAAERVVQAAENVSERIRGHVAARRQ